MVEVMGLEPTTSTLRRSSELSAAIACVRQGWSARCASLPSPWFPPRPTGSVANRLPIRVGVSTRCSTAFRASWPQVGGSIFRMATHPEGFEIDPVIVPIEDGSDTSPVAVEAWLGSLEAVSYTHLTLPTIYSV